MGLRGVLGCAVAALALALAGCGDDVKDDGGPRSGSRTVTIYSSLPLYGPDRRSSQDMVNSIKLALEEAGGKAGVLSVTYVSLDSSTREDATWTRDRVVDNARQAVRDINAIAYIGDRDSAATALSVPLTNEGGILQVSPTSGYDGLTRPGGVRTGEPERFYPSAKRTFGRMVAPDHVQASALVGYMRDEGVRRLALLGDREIEGGGIADEVERAAERQGIEVVDEGRIDASTGSLAGRAADIAATGADAFLFAGDSQTGAARIFRAVAAETRRMLLFAPSTVVDESFTAALGPAIQRRMRITTPTLPDRLLPPAARSFATRFRSTFGREPDPAAQLSYEATRVILDAIRRAGVKGNERAAVIDAFFETKDRRSVLGTYSIDRFGDTTLRRFAGNRVRGSRLVLDKVLQVRR